MSGFSRMTPQSINRERFMEGSSVKLTNAAGLDDGMVAISSLSRAMGPSVQLADVGPLLWVLLRQIAPCDAMALFLPDEPGRHVVVHYAAGVHAGALAGLTRPVSTGIIGWAAINRRAVLNAEPMFDLGFLANATPALRSSLIVPILHGEDVIAVLALYSTALLAFTEDQLDKLELVSGRLGVALSHAVCAEMGRPAAKAPILRLVKS